MVAKSGWLFEVFKFGSLALVLKVSTMIASYLFLLLLARDGGAEGVGLYTLFNSAVLLLTVFLVFGAEDSLVKLIGEGREKVFQVYYYRALLFTCGLLVLLCLVFYLGADIFIPLFFGEGFSEKYLMVVVLTVPFSCLLKINASVFKAHRSVPLYLLFQNSGMVILTLIVYSVGLMLGIEIDWWPVLSLAVSIMALSLISSILLGFYYSVARLRKFWSYVPKVSMRAHLGLASSSTISSSLSLLMGWVDVILVGSFLGAQATGVYSVSSKVAASVSILLIVLNSIMAPRIAEYNAVGGFDAVVSYVNKLLIPITIVSTFILFVLLIFGEDIISLFGRDFESGLVFYILLFGYFANAITGPVGLVLSLTGDHAIVAFISVCCLVLNILIGLSMVYSFGLVGIAVGTSVGLILNNVVLYLVVRIKRKVWLLPKF